MNTNPTKLNLITWVRKELGDLDLDLVNKSFVNMGIKFVSDDASSKITKESKNKLGDFKALVDLAKSDNLSLEEAFNQLTVKEKKASSKPQFEDLQNQAADNNNAVNRNFAIGGMVKAVQRKQAETVGTQLFMNAYNVFLEKNILPEDPILQKLILTYAELESEQNRILLGNDGFDGFDSSTDLTLDDLNLSTYNLNILPQSQTLNENQKLLGAS